MTVSRMLLAAFVALAAGVAVDHAKATDTCSPVAVHCPAAR